MLKILKKRKKQNKVYDFKYTVYFDDGKKLKGM